MNFEALVRAITEKVLAELRAAPQAPRSGERVLVLAAPDFTRMVPLEAKIRECVGPEAHIEFFKVLENSEGEGQKADRYIMPYICCPDMAALATGRATGPITRKLLDLLLAGKKVEVLEYEYSRYAVTAPQTLYSLYTGYEKTLASFGLVKFAEKKDGVARLHESLVTEKTVKEAHENNIGALIAPSGAIVTALAQDAAKELGLEILKDGEI